MIKRRQSIHPDETSGFNKQTDKVLNNISFIFICMNKVLKYKINIINQVKRLSRIRFVYVISREI